MNGSFALQIGIFRNIIGRDENEMSCLELCCGEMSNSRLFHFAEHVAVDVVDYPNRPKAYPFVQTDIRKWDHECFQRHYDVCLIADGIEHLRKTDGVELLTRMEAVANIPIVFVPLGPYQIDLETDAPEAHKSAWYPSDFHARGWKTEVHDDWHPLLKGYQGGPLGVVFAWKK